MARLHSVFLARPKPPLDALRALGRWTAGPFLLDWLLPPHCPTCDARVAHQGLMCGPCFARVSFITAPMCDHCGVPFQSAQQGGADHLCPSCRDHPPLFRRARAALRYDQHGRGLILPFKHADRLELAPVLASLMIRAGSGLLAGADILIPVPLSRGRLFQRRYNQAAILALVISRLADVPAQADALIRIRRTAPLDDKSPDQRAREVAGSIGVRPGRESSIKGKSVLLIDDVMTSGATANACTETLLRAGAASVDVLLIARVPDPRLS
jgi:ComF family protein